MAPPPEVRGSSRKPVRRRQQPTYKHRLNAVHVTVYSPTGETIPAAIRDEIQNSVNDVALKNGLLIGLALT